MRPRVVEVDAVEDDLETDPGAVQGGDDRARSPVVERHHRVGGVREDGGSARERLGGERVVRRRVTDRGDDPLGGEVLDRVEPTRELRCERHHPYQTVPGREQRGDGLVRRRRERVRVVRAAVVGRQERALEMDATHGTQLSGTDRAREAPDLLCQDVDTGGHQAREHRGRPVLGVGPSGGARGLEVLDVDANSDYGAAFGAFHEDFSSAVTRRTTVLVLGDGRGNGNDPNLPAFEEITRRARETIWLTPEPRYSWGLGGCDLPDYAEYCSRVRVVRDLTGLEKCPNLASLRLDKGQVTDLKPLKLIKLLRTSKRRNKSFLRCALS